MKVRKNHLILGYIILYFLFLPIPVKAKSSIIIPPSKDAYVWNLTPDTNDGDASWLWICNDGGTYYDTCQTLLYFKLPYGYDQYQFIELRFIVYLALNESFNLDIYHVIGPWEELSVTWNTRPSLGEYIISQTVVPQQEYLINIKPYLSSDVLSISIISTSLAVNVCRIPSHEIGILDSNQLTYIQLSQIDFFMEYISIFFALGLIGLGLIVFLLLKIRTIIHNS